MSAYYNENDAFAAAWLRNLIAAGHIAPGEVDERSIEDVRPDELAGFTQCHFFAGIGIWSHALRLAGWPDDRPVWTGSCPCQPFSAAGKSGGFADERHLWPAWFHLIEQRRPPAIFGEQVASPDGLKWLDLVQADLEGASYAVAPFDLCAAGFGAPHIRQRLYFAAYADDEGSQGRRRAELRERADQRTARKGGASGGLADSAGGGRREERADADGHAQGDRAQGLGTGSLSGSADCRPGPTNGCWRAADWLYCRDGKWRPVEPGTFPLVNGAAGRVGRLRAYGNAIVAPLAAEFVKAYRKESGAGSNP